MCAIIYFHNKQDDIEYAYFFWLSSVCSFVVNIPHAMSRFHYSQNVMHKPASILAIPFVIYV